jgi:hypothetical protein
MKEEVQVSEDEQMPSRAEVMADVVELLPSNGAVADTTGLRHVARFVLSFNWA